MPSFHPDTEIAALLDEIETGIRSVLDDDLVGLYLFGSLVYGDFTPGTSDIDLLAATRRVMNQADIARLRTMHAELAKRHPAWDGRIEVAYQSLHGLCTFMTERSPMGIISPGEPIHLIDAGDDWLVNWYFVLDHGITLAGPPPETIIPLIPRDAFVAAARALGRTWIERIHDVNTQGGESYAILTVCRALYTHHTGEPASKQRAAAWVQERHPVWSHLIETALARRVTPEDYGPVHPHPDTGRFIEMAVAEIHGDIVPQDNT